MAAAKFDLLKRYQGAAGLRDAAARSEGVKDEIKAELAAIKGIAPDRCVVTKEYRNALQGALG